MKDSVDSSFSSIALFLTLASFSIVLVWANNEFVMSKEVFHTLAGSADHSFQAEMQYEAVRRSRVWAYVLAPIQTGFRIGVVALLIQMMCLFGGIEIGYGKLFRIAAVAFGAVLFGTVLQTLWIALQPTEAATQASLGIVPDSLAAWFTSSTEMPLLVHLILSRFSITSLLWMMLLYWGLRETDRLQQTEAGFVTVSTWAALSALKVGATLFARELVS